MKGAVLVTGGAGYIGAHLVLALADRGDRVVVLDNLSTGWREMVPQHVPFVHAGVEDRDAVLAAVREHQVGAVVHMAGSILVGESVEQPLAYHRNNVAHAIALAEALADAGVARLLFSSTAAVYGVPDVVPIPEEAPTRPINPYGRNKLAVEWLFRDAAEALGWQLGILRYFNVAGADSKGRAGQSTRGATHLIKMVAEAAAGLRDGVEVFGQDYPTRDGTGLRDYVHVEDLARAHLLALDALDEGHPGFTYNVGDGRGHTVLEVLDAADRLLPRPIRRTLAPRRAGDPPALVASAQRIADELGWRPAPGGLERMIADAIRWEKQQARAPATG